MTAPSTARPLRFLLCWIVFLIALGFLGRASANGGDLPAQILLQGFAKPEDGHVRVLVRVPLVLLSSFSLPKRDPGYLDLSRIDDKLKLAATATGKQIELFEDGVLIVPSVRAARLSLLSDRSFAAYPAALAHVEGPPLPVDTDLFWNQGFFDTELDYPLRSKIPSLSLGVNVAPELGARVKLNLVLLPEDGPPRAYELPGGSGAVPLDPGVSQAAWLFAKAAFFDAFALDRFVFLLCLIAPFRRFGSVLVVVLVMTAVQAFMLTLSVAGMVPATHWLPAVYDSTLAGAIVLLAIANLSAPSLRRRWFLASLVGALGGFGLGQLLGGILQFAGDHRLASGLFFNVGVALGEVAMLALAMLLLRLFVDRVLGPVLGVVVLSGLAGLLAWYWVVDRNHELGHELGHVVEAGLSSSLLASAAWWLAPALLMGVIAHLLPRRLDGQPIRSLRTALLDRTT